MTVVYDQIGTGYAKHRCADHRIVNRLVDLIALPPPATIADIGAGTGSYSHALADLGFQIEAIEPSDEMRQQSIVHGSVRWFNGTAEHIPLPDRSVDAILCILASHHFPDLPSAVAEMMRICPDGPVIWFTCDPREVDHPWLADYFPAIWEEVFRVFPPLSDVCRLLTAHGARHIEVLPWLVPHDLQDCFMAAGWRKPEMYLDAGVRACMSAFRLADPEQTQSGLSRLRQDVTTGKWQSEHRELLCQTAVDWGYRFLKATRDAANPRMEHYGAQPR